MNLKYHIGTFERSKSSAIKDMIRSMVKIGTIMAVINVAKYGFEIHIKQYRMT